MTALSHKFWCAVACLAFVTGLATAAPAATLGSPPRVCSGGVRDGRVCGDDGECRLGVCAETVAVCDGGSDDGFRCPCPASACSAATPCADTPSSGTCAGGPLAGSCCSLEFGCGDGKPCVASHKVCAAGRFRGAACLRDAHCPESVCVSSGKTCDGGIYPRRACVDNADCPNSFCGTAPNCIGDCDHTGEVTVDELVMMVNIALGGAQLDACRAADGNLDGQVTVDEILAAVNAALRGCIAPAAS